uniref:Signal peptide-containing protein n=1 Tax=Spironucleus salmonicida TaxID=348837 RepID=V6LTN2_9EUKA|eukprot:EST48007.1 Signal peptide-containing protein [Spironucleus salmonicida]
MSSALCSSNWWRSMTFAVVAALRSTSQQPLNLEPSRWRRWVMLTPRGREVAREEQPHLEAHADGGSCRSCRG